jgi:hypothetical protein
VQARLLHYTLNLYSLLICTSRACTRPTTSNLLHISVMVIDRIKSLTNYSLKNIDSFWYRVLARLLNLLFCEPKDIATINTV